MLSTAAFNAFLKTLEEPPNHAIFILATTEKHKLLPTILSRCQIYDFQRITIEDIVEHLRYVASQEGFTVDDDALNVIARKADGGMRDALSIFDQVAASSGTAALLVKMLPAIPAAASTRPAIKPNGSLFFMVFRLRFLICRYYTSIWLYGKCQFFFFL